MARDFLDRRAAAVTTVTVSAVGASGSACELGSRRSGSAIRAEADQPMRRGRDGSAGSAGAAISVPAIMNAARPAAAHGPRPRANGRSDGDEARASPPRRCVARSTRPDECCGRFARAVRGGDCPAGRCRLAPATAAAAKTAAATWRPRRIGSADERGRAPGSAAEQAAGGEQRPGGEQQAAARGSRHVGDEPGGAAMA